MIPHAANRIPERGRPPAPAAPPRATETEARLLALIEANPDAPMRVFAAALGVSCRTVDAHWQNIRRKFRVTSRAAAVRAWRASTADTIDAEARMHAGAAERRIADVLAQLEADTGLSVEFLCLSGPESGRAPQILLGRRSAADAH
jgi:DNA-binding CsgD family transcriptional regulator